MDISNKSITMIKPDDMHLHIRQGDSLINYVQETARQCARAVIMPNTLPPITTPTQVEEYRAFILEHSQNFEPLMTFKILPKTEVSSIALLKEAGAIIGKYYPAGATTNAEDGANSMRELYPIFAELERLDMVLSLHGEVPEALCTEREQAFVPLLKKLAADFPKLRIILEHVSSHAAVAAVTELPATVAATITVHHMYLTLDDVIKNPHNLCMPIAKSARDRDAVLQAALSGNPKFFFGTDSAPHMKQNKERVPVSAGVYSAPVALQLLVELFEEHSALDKLEAFCSKFGADFYKLPYNTQTITLKKSLFKVPDICYGVVPFKAGETVRWSIDD